MSNPDRYQLPNDTTFYLSFHMLCGFSAELYLKAFLLHNGVPESELRKANVRHDLHALHALAARHGLSDGAAKKLTDFLGKHHKTYEFRYMSPESVYEIMNLVEVFLAFSSLDNEVDKAIGASASKGRNAGGAWVFPKEHANWRF